MLLPVLEFVAVVVVVVVEGDVDDDDDADDEPGAVDDIAFDRCLRHVAICASRTRTYERKNDDDGRRTTNEKNLTLATEHARNYIFCIFDTFVICQQVLYAFYTR